MARVYTGGTFDLFHAGHVNFLRQCYNLSRTKKFPNLEVPDGFTYSDIGRYENPEVIVSLNTDKFILDYKGKAPVYTYEERKSILLGCRYVDRVIENFGDTDSKPAILSVKPDYIVIGSDWASKDYYKQMDFTQQWLDEQNIALIYVPYTPGVTTTELKERIIRT